MAKLNMAYLSSLKNQQNCCRPTCRCQAACHGKTEHGIFVKFKNTSKTAVVLLAGAKPLVMAKLNMAYLSSLKNQQNCCRPTCRCQAACHGKTEHGIFVKLKNQQNCCRPTCRCQADCHGKTEHGIFVKFKKPAKLLSSYLPVPSRLSWQNWTWHICQV